MGNLPGNFDAWKCNDPRDRAKPVEPDPDWERDQKWDDEQERKGA